MISCGGSWPQSLKDFFGSLLVSIMIFTRGQISFANIRALSFHIVYIDGCFHKLGDPQKGLFIMENLSKIDNLGVPPFMKPSHSC